MIRSLSVWVTSAALAMLAVLTTDDARAQSTRERLTLLEQQMLRIERVIANNNDSQTEILRKLQELQAENQALRNEIEKLQFETVQAADRQRQLYLDLDQRLQAMSSARPSSGAAGIAPGTVPTAPNVSQPNDQFAGQPAVAPVGSDEADYQASFDLLKKGNYSDAAASFNRFLVMHPQSNLLDNAEYWLAEISYAQQDFGAALSQFQKVIASYPSSRKIPDAWLKVGYCQYELNRWVEARQALNIVVTQFPETTAARLARDRLNTIKREGR